LINQSGSLVYYYLLGSTGKKGYLTALVCLLICGSSFQGYMQWMTASFLFWSTELSLSVPICNSLTFVFTALTSWVLGEKIHRPLQAVGGMMLVLAGIAISVQAKATTTTTGGG